MSTQLNTSRHAWLFAGSTVALLAGAGGLAAVANFLPWQVATAVGVVAGTAGFSGTLLQERRTARRALDRTWQATISGSHRDSAAATDSPLSILNPECRVVAFNKVRERDLHALLGWCLSEQGEQRIWLVAGSAGSGKTRLLMEAAARLDSQQWLCGWINRGAHHGVTAVDVAHAYQRPVLLIVDDADTYTDLAAALAALLQHPPCGVRMVLAAREFGAWWASLRASLDQDTARLLSTTATTVLQPLGRDGHDQQQLFTQALQAYARYTNAAIPAATFAGTTPTPELLLIHAAASVGVHNQRTGSINIASALTELFTLEEGRWQQTTVGTSLRGLGTAVLRSAVIVAVLFGADDRDDAVGLLRRLPGLTRADTDLLGHLADWLRDQYPHSRGGWLNPRLPAGLAEHYAVTHLAGTPPLREAVVSIATTTVGQHHGNAERMLRYLANATTHVPEAATVVSSILLENSDLLVTAVEVAKSSVGQIDQVIAEVVATTALTADLLDDLEADIPYPTQSLAHTAVAVASAQLRFAEVGKHRAVRLNDFALRLAAVGRHEEGANASTEAVRIYRRLAAEDRVTYEPQLAGALITLGNWLSELGRREEALTITTQAVEIYQELTKYSPDIFEPRLATALQNRGIALAAVGRREEALGPTIEATEIFRRLAAADPDTFEPELASGLHNLGNRLDELGQRDNALAVTTDALDILRRLAAANPDAQQPALAGTLHDLGNRLKEMGRREEALTAAAEAVGVFGKLAATNPDGHEPDLVAALHNLGVELAAAGRTNEALAASTEAVEICQRLFAANSDAFATHLARALANLGLRLAEKERYEKALITTSQAVEMFRQLAMDNPDAFEPHLGAALHDLGNWLTAVGRQDEAVAASLSAVKIIRRLAAANPDAFEPQLAGALHDLGNVLAAAGRRDEALAATTQAVELFRQLHSRWPEAFRQSLAVAERSLRAHLPNPGPRSSTA